MAAAKGKSSDKGNPPPKPPRCDGCKMNACIVSGVCEYTAIGVCPAAKEHADRQAAERAATKAKYTAEAESDRDGSGRFQKGCKAGPGNPHLANVQRAKAEFWRSIEHGDTALITRALIADAQVSGNTKSQQLYFQLVGLLKSKADEQATGNNLITPDEARARVAAFFGLKIDEPPTVPCDPVTEGDESET